MKLNDFFEECGSFALAFSGGVDSSYLLSAAVEYGCRVRAYYVRTAFQPRFEFDDALAVAKRLGAELRVIELDVLSCGAVVSNPPDRCYHCKRLIFSRIADEAARDGFDIIADGTNASDDASDRPGMLALRELGVRSPLRECGLTKDEIRLLSLRAGLPTWSKPAYACLATRIQTGEAITAEKLERTENAETFLMSLGLSDFRVRMCGSSAKIQIPERQLGVLLKNRRAILEELKSSYGAVTLDLEFRPDTVLPDAAASEPGDARPLPGI